MGSHNEELLARLTEKQKSMKKKKNFMPVFIMIQLLILSTCFYLPEKSPQNAKLIIMIMMTSVLTLCMLVVTQLYFMNLKSWKERVEKDVVLNLLKDKSK
ncbi:hypothetical protein PQO01_09250 [Lentisphaera marina]|uniref:hypothetical protein n=1 Tax=Lentisphaera marina TaxID=1111041 RepID=UPI002366A6A2|nr:hypothetical protein [Lentisphaera marina]MDD7985134.1 hypothetical protein [Lentisphaera marina]